MADRKPTIIINIYLLTMILFTNDDDDNVHQPSSSDLLQELCFSSDPLRGVSCQCAAEAVQELSVSYGPEDGWKETRRWRSRVLFADDIDGASVGDVGPMMHMLVDHMILMFGWLTKVVPRFYQ